MRTHSEIISAAGGATAVHRALRLEPHRIHAVRSWIQRGSIPAEFFADFVEAGFSTFEELGLSARQKRTERAA
jgi:hypothetical protein